MNEWVARRLEWQQIPLVVADREVNRAKSELSTP
jgi:hypothetical protein